ncbi:MAG: hypothetical protein K6T65_15245, partial [Peptococcaceae bacterium]|nr:hypothetical protein [Peptococcaceae bacterium]
MKQSYAVVLVQDRDNYPVSLLPGTSRRGFKDGNRSLIYVDLQLVSLLFDSIRAIKILLLS